MRPPTWRKIVELRAGANTTPPWPHQLLLSDRRRGAHLEVWPGPSLAASKRRGGNDS
jgi:hypothetical protein